MIRSLEHQNVLRSQPKHIERLSRFVGLIPCWWPIPQECSSAWPLYHYYLTLLNIGQVNIAQDLHTIVHIIMKDYLDKKSPLYGRDHRYVDDHIRGSLKGLSGHCFPLVFTRGPAYMLLCHLHAMLAKAPYTEEQIVKDISRWVSSSIDGDRKEILPGAYKRGMDIIMESC
nr:RNA-dependent RNA polymerase [Molussus totiviridae 5]